MLIEIIKTKIFECCRFDFIERLNRAGYFNLNFEPILTFDEIEPTEARYA